MTPVAGRTRVPLTVCPLATSVSASSTTSPAPLPELIERGLFVTLNSDENAYFAGYSSENYQAVAEAFGLPSETLRILVRNSFEAALLDDADKAALIGRVDAYCTASPTSSYLIIPTRGLTTRNPTS